MVEHAPVNKNTLKSLKRAAGRLDRAERRKARNRLRNNGYSFWDALRPSAGSPSELYKGHEWMFVNTSSDGARTEVGLSYGIDNLKIEITPPISQPSSLEIPVSRRGNEARERTWKDTRPLTERTAKTAEELLKELISSRN